MKRRIGFVLALLALGGCMTPVDELRELPPVGTSSLPGGAGNAAYCVARQLNAWPGNTALPNATNTVQLTDNGAYVYGTSGANGMWLIDAVNSGGNAALTYRLSNWVTARDMAARLIEGGIANCRIGG